MVNRFPFVHSFRLSNEDEKRYNSLLNRFHISSSSQSVAFRSLLRELASLMRDLDDEEISPSVSLPAAQFQPDADEEELDLWEMEPNEDQGDEPDYAQYRQEAVHRLVSRGQMVIYKNILAEVRAIKKEKDIQ